MGWEALELWGKDAARIERLAGGVANNVWSVHVHGADDGRLFADGLMVMKYMHGGPPETEGLASRSRDPPRTASFDARLAAAPRVAILDGPPACRDGDEDRPCRDAARGRRSMPRGVGTAYRT